MNIFFQKIKNAYIKIKIAYDCYMQRKKLNSIDFSIISNNCWGGLMSQRFGLPYMSPTCGLLIQGHDYIKFCSNINFYLTQKLEFIPFDQANYYFQFKDLNPFPVGILDDIEVYFMHYKTEEDAAEKWYRRTKRINWNNIIFKISERESFTKEDMIAFAKLPIKNKLIFGENPYSHDTIIIPGIHSFIGDETPLIDDYFNIIEYINRLNA